MLEEVNNIREKNISDCIARAAGRDVLFATTLKAVYYRTIEEALAQEGLTQVLTWINRNTGNELHLWLFTPKGAELEDARTRNYSCCGIQQRMRWSRWGRSAQLRISTKKLRKAALLYTDVEGRNLYVRAYQVPPYFENFRRRPERDDRGHPQ